MFKNLYRYKLNGKRNSFTRESYFKSASVTEKLPRYLYSFSKNNSDKTDVMTLSINVKYL